MPQPQRVFVSIKQAKSRKGIETYVDIDALNDFNHIEKEQCAAVMVAALYALGVNINANQPTNQNDGFNQSSKEIETNIPEDVSEMQKGTTGRIRKG